MDSGMISNKIIPLFYICKNAFQGGLSALLKFYLIVKSDAKIMTYLVKAS